MVVKDVEQRIVARKFCVCNNVINLSEATFFRRGRFQLRSYCLGCASPCDRIAPSLPGHRDDDGDECNSSITRSHKSNAEKPSMRKPASKDMTSDSVQLCETAVCFLHSHQRSTSEDAQNVPRDRFWVFKIPSKIGILR